MEVLEISSLHCTKIYLVGGQRHAPAALHPGKTRYPLYRRLCWLRGRSGRVWKISPPTRIRSPDRPARNESLYRLSYPGPHSALRWIYYRRAEGFEVSLVKKMLKDVKLVWLRKC
jgi:hypothetical protein